MVPEAYTSSTNSTDKFKGHFTKTDGVKKDVTVLCIQFRIPVPLFGITEQWPLFSSRDCFKNLLL